jgi:predicted nucleotidyltransferase
MHEIKETFEPMLRECVDSLRQRAMNDGLTPQQRKEIREILAGVPRIDRAILFGSRAQGTYRRASDIDLALEGADISLSDTASLYSAFAESSLPYDVDLVVRADNVNRELERRIARHGMVFYEK